MTLEQTTSSKAASFASNGAFVAGIGTTVAGGVAKAGSTAASWAGLAGETVSGASFGIDYWNYKAGNIDSVGHLLTNWAFDAIGVTDVGAPIAIV